MWSILIFLFISCLFVFMFYAAFDVLASEKTSLITGRRVRNWWRAESVYIMKAGEILKILMSKIDNSDYKCLIKGENRTFVNVENSTMLRKKTIRVFFTAIQVYSVYFRFFNISIIDSSVCLGVETRFIFIKKLKNESCYLLLNHFYTCILYICILAFYF